jgi:hypothetical protein
LDLDTIEAPRPPIHSAHERCVPVGELVSLFFSTPWSITDVLERLAAAAEHTMRDHGCDAHGWEEVNGCIPRARAYAAALRSLIQRGGGR